MAWKAMTRMMKLSGDDNIPAMPVSSANVNHLRRLLAWLRCEYCLDGNSQHGLIVGLSKAVEVGMTTNEHAGELLEAQVTEIARVPAYVRQAVKMLTFAIQQHDAQSGIVNHDSVSDRKP